MGHRPPGTPDGPANVEPLPEPVPVAVAVTVLDSPDVWQAPEPTPTTANDNGVIWTPNPIKARDPAYFHHFDDLLAKYLPDASLSAAFVFEDHEGRWIASQYWDFATRTFKLERAPIPTKENLP